MSIIHYKARNIFRHHLPGFLLFKGYFLAYGHGVMPCDRSHTIRFPVKTKSLFPLPAIDGFDKSYELCCMNRAVELIERAERLDVPLYVFWSGGIDSTTALVSLLRVASLQERERVTVLMSSASVSEYPAFYREHVFGKLKCAPAAQFPHLLGRKLLMVNGEHNDQLFGSDVIANAIKQFGFDKVVAPYDRELMTDFFTEQMEGSRLLAAWYVEHVFERLREAAPVKLKTNYDMLWWINFAVKWQNVFMRMLSFADKPLTAEWVHDYYAPFFCTPDFQRWSMTNLDQRVHGSWRSYKWPAKDVIFGFTKDPDYRDNKLKLGSLKFLTAQTGPVGFIDEQFGFHKDLAPEVFYEPANDFLGA